MTTAQHVNAPPDAAPTESQSGVGLVASTLKTMLSSHAWIRDILFALAFLAVWWIGIAIGLSLQWRPIDLGHYATVGFLTAGAIAVCRRYPIAGLVGVAIATGWPDWWFQVPAVRVIPLVVAGYLAASAGLRLVVALPIALAGAFFALVPIFAYFGMGVPALEFVLDSLRYMDPSGRILASGLVVAAVLLGRSAFAQRRAVAELEQRNEELVRLREADVVRIATEERTAIAREIHDVVAHHVSAMVIRAQAADRVASKKPAELRETVRWIARSGQEALTAMRQVVKVLRADDATPIDRTATTFAASLEKIVSRVREAGLRVDVSVEEDLEPSTIHELAILRIVQEALTNVLLHSSASLVTVDLFTKGETVQLRVEDDGAVSTVGKAAKPDRNGGSGLRGMRERAESAGGSLRTGRSDRGDRGGWIVEAVLPLGGTVAS